MKDRTYLFLGVSREEYCLIKGNPKFTKRRRVPYHRQKAIRRILLDGFPF